MTRQEAIEHWAKEIIPAVLAADLVLQQKHPEWQLRLESTKDADYETRCKVADEYTRAIAEIILGRTSDEELAEMNN